MLVLITIWLDVQPNINIAKVLGSYMPIFKSPDFMIFEFPFLIASISAVGIFARRMTAVDQTFGFIIIIFSNELLFTLYAIKTGRKNRKVTMMHECS